MNTYSDNTTAIFTRALERLGDTFEKDQISRLRELIDTGTFHVPADVLAAVDEEEREGEMKGQSHADQ